MKSILTASGCPSSSLGSHEAGRIARLRARNEWSSSRCCEGTWTGCAWWVVLLLRGVLPALLPSPWACSSAPYTRREPRRAARRCGVVFLLLQVLTPIHQASGQTGRSNGRLALRPADRRVRAPSGMGHLEDPKLTNDLTVARDSTRDDGPPLSTSMDFIANGLVELIGGLSSALILAAYAWWAPLVLGGACCNALAAARERDLARPQHRRSAAARSNRPIRLRLAVDPPASKELRLFGLADWTIDRFVARRRRLHDLQYAATRLRERPVVWSMLLVVGANIMVFWSLADAVVGGRLGLDQLVIFAQSAVGVSMIAFGTQLGERWASAPVAAVLAARAGNGRAGALASGTRLATGASRARDPLSRCHVRLPAAHLARALRPHDSRRILAGHRRQNGPAKRSSPASVPFVRPERAPLRSTATTCALQSRGLAVTSYRRLPGFIRFELSVRDNVAPAAPRLGGSGGAGIRGAAHLATLDTVLARATRGARLVGRAMAAGCAGACLVRRAARSLSCCWTNPRRTRRPGRSRDLRPHPCLDAAVHHDSDLAPLLHCASADRLCVLEQAG